MAPESARPVPGGPPPSGRRPHRARPSAEPPTRGVFPGRKSYTTPGEAASSSESGRGEAAGPGAREVGLEPPPRPPHDQFVVNRGARSRRSGRSSRARSRDADSSGARPRRDRRKWRHVRVEGAWRGNLEGAWPEGLQKGGVPALGVWPGARRGTVRAVWGRGLQSRKAGFRLWGRGGAWSPEMSGYADCGRGLGAREAGFRL